MLLFVSDFEIFVQSEGYDCLKQINSTSLIVDTTSYTPEQEKRVLLDMYQGTNGHNWYNQSGWSTPNQTSHCYWYGITCHSNTSYVKTITMSYNNLEGSLPTTLWKLRNLLSLCITGNRKLHGRMDDLIFANMTSLRIIIVSDTSIAGRIPDAFGRLTSLERFLACVMPGKGLSGPLPESIGNMTQLRLLCLEGNAFTGQIPQSISQLRKIFYLDLRNAPGKMSGNLEHLLSISSLKFLSVSGIELQGRFKVIPPAMQYFDLTDNRIEGTLPKTFPKSLLVLNVANNKLTGDVPGQLFLLPEIQLIDLSQNLFTSINSGAPCPSNNQSQLRYVSLAANRNLTIDLDSFLRMLLNQHMKYPGPNLAVLNISFCDLQTAFPERLLSFCGLTICDLRNNKLNGSIPNIFPDYCYLTYLDVSLNDLSGDLPLGIISLMSLQNLDISGNPKMQQTKEHATNILQPDFTKMFRPGPVDNYTCAEGRLTFNNGHVRLDPTFYEYKYCVCDSGFYGDSGLCKKCMSGGTCHKPVVVTTNDLEPSTMKMHAGYWPSPSASKVTHLVRCPIPEACNPNGNCTCQLPTSSNLTSQSNRSVSSLITSCNTSCVCHFGNTDRFCSRCQKGFYKNGGLCFPCPKPKDNFSFYVFISVFAVTVLVMLGTFLYFRAAPQTALIIVAVELLIIFVLVLLKLFPAWVLKLDVIFVLFLFNRAKRPHSLIKVGVFYIQTLDSMVSTYDVWPRQIFAAQHYISSFWNLHFASLSCEFSVLFDPVGEFAFVLLLPLFCMFFIFLYFVISCTYGKLLHHENHIKNTRFKCRQLSISFINFAYFPIVQATLSVLRPCDDDQGVKFMPKNPWIECNTQTYHVLSIMGWLSVVFYIIGFPVILFTLMSVFFKKRTLMNIEEKEELDSWLGSLYLPYKEDYRQYFEFILVIRRLLLAFSLSFLASLGSMQTVVVWLILVVSAIIQFRLQPYETTGNLCSFENIFEFVILFVLSMSFMVLRFAALGSSFATLFVWFVMVVNGCVLIALVSCFLYRFGRKRLNNTNDRNDVLLENPMECDE